MKKVLIFGTFEEKSKISKKKKNCFFVVMGKNILRMYEIGYFIL